MKLRQRILALVLGILAVSILALSIPLYWYTRSALEDELDKRLLSVARIAASRLNMDLLQVLIREPDLPNVRTALEEEVSAFTVDEIDGIAIFSEQGIQLAQVSNSRSGDGEISVLLQSLSSIRSGKTAVSEIYQLSGGDYLKAAAIRMDVSQDLSAVVVVWAGAEFMSVIDQLVGSIFWIVLMAIVVAAALAVVFSRSIIRPVRQLSAYAQSIERNIHSDSVDLGRKDEFGDLNRSLSEMHVEIKQHEQSTKQLLSGIAHEIKNPLGGIEIYTGLLNEEFAKDSAEVNPEEHRTYLEKITRELRHLKQIVLEYLDYARPLKSDLDAVPIESVCEDVHRILLPEIRQKSVQYIQSGNGVVSGDESKLRRVFVNLLKNSLEAVEENGTITVTIESRDSVVTTDVSDNGRGIRENDLENIFNPYFTTQERGYGLGLTIAKNIMDEMNGTIIVESTIGKGTKFTLEFPKE